jgi:hypothetical protein
MGGGLGILTPWTTGVCKSFPLPLPDWRPYWELGLTGVGNGWGRSRGRPTNWWPFAPTLAGTVREESCST